MRTISPGITVLLTSWLLTSWLAACGLAAEPAAAWPTLPPLPAGPFVVPAAGGIRAGTLVAIDDARITLDSPTAGMIHLPRSSVAGFRASLAIGPPSAPPQARITFTNGDVAAATTLSARDGTIHFMPARAASAEVSAPLDRVLAIDFPVATQPTGRGVWSALDDGSRFAADPPPVAGAVASVAEGAAFRLLASLPAEDGAVAGGAAVQPAWPAARGLTAFTACLIQAPARVTYRLDKPGSRFRTRMAIDDAAGPWGSVVVTIRARAAGAGFHEVFTSPIIRGGDDPLAIDVPLDGARDVELVVDPADAGPVLDRTIWLDPRITFE